MINKYTYLKDIKVIDTSDEKILIKKKKRYDIDKIYKYLDDHNISNYLKPFKITDKNLYFNYLNKKELDNDEVAKHLVYALSDLQNKTTIYKEIDKDKLKEEYDVCSRFFKKYQCSDKELIVTSFEILDEKLKDDFVDKNFSDLKTENVITSFILYALDQEKEFEKIEIITDYEFDANFENKIKEKTGAHSRCIPFTQEYLSDTCAVCGKKAQKEVIWGRQY